MSAEFRERVAKMLSQPETCPGGLPGEQAVVRHLPQLWVHLGDDVNNSDSVQLLRCQSALACLEDPQIANADQNVTRRRRLGTRNTSVVAQLDELVGATCGDGFQQGSFLCSECEDGYVKLAGDCIACGGFNVIMLAMTLVVNVFMSLFLLHKSANPIIPRDELEKIWDKIDGAGRGQLAKDDVGKVLELLGALPYLHVVSAEVDDLTEKQVEFREKALAENAQRNNKLDKMCVEFNRDKIAAMGGGNDSGATADKPKAKGCCKKRLKKEQVAVRMETVETIEVESLESAELTGGGDNDDDAKGHGPEKVEKQIENQLASLSVVTKGDFVKVRAGKSPTASMGIIIFFFQSLGLIMKKSGAFGVMDALNLDTEEAVKECVSPLGTINRFYAKVTVTPLVLFLGVCLMVPAAVGGILVNCSCFLLLLNEGERVSGS